MGFNIPFHIWTRVGSSLLPPNTITMPSLRGRKQQDSSSHTPSNDVDGPSSHRPPSFAVGGSRGSNANLSNNNSNGRRSARIRAVAMLLATFMMVLASFYLTFGLIMESKMQQQQPHTNSAQAETKVTRDKFDTTKQRDDKQSTPNNKLDKCAFRSYPPNRLYGLFSKNQPSFLSDATYIRGQHPIIINPLDSDDESITPPTKVCMDTTSWEKTVDKDGVERLPFTDGHNPSVISLSSNPYGTDENNPHSRLDPKYLQPIASAFPSYSLDSLYLGISIFGNGQCKFGLTPDEVNSYRFSTYDDPPNGKRAVIAILSPPNPTDGHAPFQTMTQSTLLLERDSKYGTNRRALQPQKTDPGYARMHQEFDDPRLFFFDGRLWVLYRNGPLFGYNEQIHNPIHFEEVQEGDAVDGDVKFVAYVKASETVR